MNFLNKGSFLSERFKMEMYPPFFLMRVKVLEISARWHRVRMKLPLNWLSRNPGGVMFGGYIACLADPIAAIACSRNYAGYSCWTRASTIDFIEGGTTDLVFKFDFPPELDAAIRADLAAKGRATPTFECGFFRFGDPTETLTVKVTNTVAIRQKNYIKATSPAVADEFAAPAALAMLQEMLRRRIVGSLELKGAGELTEARLEDWSRRLGVGTEGAKTLQREEFDQLLDALGVAAEEEGRADDAARAQLHAQRDALWALIDVRGVGEISAKDFLDFWRRTFMDQADSAG